MNFNLLNNLVDLCSRKGISDVVLCPGSRSAPITLSFLRNKFFHCRTFSDERSAAFIALGIAQETHSPVALVCTSGSAAYNFAPAISEAFFQQVPLIVLTADRPKEWIDQLDGQTIRQANLYSSHVKKYYELSVDDTHPDAGWYASRIINEAVNLSLSGAPGPVHINIPLREPLYPGGSEPVVRNPLKNIESIQTKAILSDDQVKSIARDLSGFKKILIVSGQNESDSNLAESVSSFHPKSGWPVVGDILSNLHSLPFFCRHTDTYLGQIPDAVKADLRPDLIISFGKSVVAKNLKLFLRNCENTAHWHIQPVGEAADTFKRLTKIISVEPVTFFNQLSGQIYSEQNEAKAYRKKWDALENPAQSLIAEYFNSSKKSEFTLVNEIMRSLPQPCNLHLANSMSVRYANH
ncbi:MAG TPA: 2-succinyl-5-enolpyruvyl-6-hydroxy-3-cyclohexene-1-carboxylic-acid synthase, partial [Cyclobacteriaceae bacterium]|nr:2-succinyl-5-enolpyruvyl-6-hydroxy-3-cyclohexene-1-carboxylic-acid synthase [Cyclobacteriaceae bacterium]